MGKLYEVQFSWVEVVYAESLEEAENAVRANRTDMLSHPDIDFSVYGPLTKQELIQTGYDLDCLPYGHDGKTRIRDIPEVFPDEAD